MRRASTRRIVLAVVAVLLLAVVVLNWTYGRLPAEPKPSGSFAQVGKLRIHYLERPGSGPTVVLIHGLPGTAEDFERVTPLLAGYRTIAIDRPGYGYSTGGYVPFERQLTTIHELLAKLGVVRPIVVGHSYGGTIALGYAERYPSDVRALVLVDAAAVGQHPGGFERLQAHATQIMELPVLRQIANATFGQLLLTASAEQGDSEAFAPQSVAPAHLARLLEINMTRGNLEAPAGERLAAGGVVARIDRRLPAIRQPAVVIQGNADHLVTPIYGRRLAAALPNAHLVMVVGGHMVPYTHPASVAAAVKAVASASAHRSCGTGVAADGGVLSATPRATVGGCTVQRQRPLGRAVSPRGEARRFRRRLGPGGLAVPPRPHPSAGARARRSG
jgi:pimeloyl-ACP methyl ester carboxylesterase